MKPVPTARTIDRMLLAQNQLSEFRDCCGRIADILPMTVNPLKAKGKDDFAEQKPSSF